MTNAADYTHIRKQRTARHSRNPSEEDTAPEEQSRRLLGMCRTVTAGGALRLGPEDGAGPARLSGSNTKAGSVGGPGQGLLRGLAGAGLPALAPPPGRKRLTAWERKTIDPDTHRRSQGALTAHPLPAPASATPSRPETCLPAPVHVTPLFTSLRATRSPGGHRRTTAQRAPDLPEPSQRGLAVLRGGGGTRRSRMQCHLSAGRRERGRDAGPRASGMGDTGLGAGPVLPSGGLPLQRV